MSTSIVVNASGLAQGLMFKVKFVSGLEHMGSSFELSRAYCDWSKDKPIRVLSNSILAILAATGLESDEQRRFELWVLGKDYGSNVLLNSMSGSLLTHLSNYGVESYVHPGTNVVFSLA